MATVSKIIEKRQIAKKSVIDPDKQALGHNIYDYGDEERLMSEIDEDLGQHVLEESPG